MRATPLASSQSNSVHMTAHVWPSREANIGVEGNALALLLLQGRPNPLILLNIDVTTGETLLQYLQRCVRFFYVGCGSQKGLTRHFSLALIGL